MLKIRRCHLSCVGNRNARFSPVGLDFTADNGGGASNSLVFLENGGGKTTLAAFLYLTLWPEQNHFLLKKAKDSQVRVASYLMAGQTAYAILECETRVASLLDDPIVRVIGQVLLRRDASDRSPINRHFFTFIPRPGLMFADLPIHGINGQKASLSFEEFGAWLKQKQTEFPSAEMWESKSVEEYLKKLREIHAEPELVRVQVDLNKREGGIKDHFKEHCADSRKFVHTLLDLALQSAKGDETAGVLGKFLSEWQNVGHLEDETDFCDKFAAALSTLADAHSRWTKSDEKLQSWRRQAAGFWHALNTKVEELRQQQSATEESLREVKRQAADAKRDVDNSNHHVISYELEWLELRAAEATAAATEAEQQCQIARRADHLRKLAVLLGDIERRRRDLEAKRRILEEKQAELAPLLDKLNALGAAFAARLANETTQVEGESSAAAISLKLEQERATTLENAQQALAIERSGLERTIGEVKSFFDRRRYQRDQLGDDGRLEANERAEDGRTRWTALRESEQTNVTEQRQRHQQLGRRLNDLSGERARIEREAAKAEGEANQLQSKLNDAQQQRAAISGHDLVVAHFGEGFDPLRHGAEEDLARKQADAFHALLNHQLDLAVLERNREGIGRYQVLPPPRDVETVLRQLSEANVEAISGLRYLAETCGCDEAERLIRTDPARYAGVLVSPKDWNRVATLGWPEVTQPVEVSPFPEKFVAEETSVRQIVLPTRAAFEKAEASRRALRLEDEGATTKRQLEARRTEYDDLGAVLTLLRAFVEQYGDGKLAELDRDLQAKLRHAEALRTRSGDIQGEIESVSHEQQAARDAELASLELLQKKIEPALNALNRFIADFEDKADGMRANEAAAQTRLLAIEGEETALKSKRETCKEEIATKQHQMFLLQEKNRQLRAEAGGIHYQQAALDEKLFAQSLDDLRSSYQQQRLLYEGQQDSEAKVEIRAGEEVLESKRSEFSRQLKDVTETEVRTIAEPNEYSEAKLREQSDLASRRLDDAVNFRAAKNAERETAKTQYGEKERSAPESGKRRFPEGEIRPRTSSDAFALLERGRHLLRTRQEAKQNLDEQVRSLGEQTKDFEKSGSDYEAQRNLLDGFQALESVSVELSRDFVELKAAVAAVRNEEKTAASDEQRERRDRNGKLKTAKDVTTDTRFAEKKLSLAKRFETYTDESLLTDLAQIRADLDQRIASNRDRLAGLKQTREQLVHMMDGLADEVLALLRSIEKVSRLPEEGMGVWSGKPFIQISFHQPDDSERQVALRGLLEELVEVRRVRNDEAPDTDASGLMRLIADRLVCDKRIRVQILKPTPVRTNTYEDVEMLRHYSGGEGVTVAILMYLTIVQLRAQSLQSSRRLQDAGFLLLDNPFGECNREDLVRMQVQLAEQLRVQLIVLTGLREPVIMMSYPRRVRLVNDLLNRVTGAKHVRVAEGNGHITGVENLRRFNLNGA